MLVRKTERIRALVPDIQCTGIGQDARVEAAFVGKVLGGDT